MNDSGKKGGFSLLHRFTGLWLIYAGWSATAGWFLSAFGVLGAGGYGIAFLILCALSATWWVTSAPARRARVISYWRLRNPAFLAWVIVAVVALIGGVLHAPTNYDALTYRLPRVMYWLQEGQWFWLGALNVRMDIAGTGVEWMSAPLLLIPGGSRALFLLNYVPFLLLPGLFFSTAVSLGIRPRHARWWMWLFPLAYGFALQAGGIGNDMIGAALGLAAASFALKAPSHRPVLCLFLSALAIAVLSGIKVTTFPACLPLAGLWAFMAFRTWGLSRTILNAFAFGLVLIPVSLLPCLFLNWKYSGSLTGNPDNIYDLQVHAPAAGLAGNSLQLFLSSIQPPLLPLASRLNDPLQAWTDSSPRMAWIKQNYNGFSLSFGKEIPGEEGAGLGIGVSLLLLFWLLLGKPHRTALRCLPSPALLVSASMLTLFIVLMATAAGNSAPRFFLPLAPFAVLGVLSLTNHFSHPLSRQKWLVPLILALLVLPAVLLSPGRPLIPIPSIARNLDLPTSLQKRIADVYGTYSQRSEILRPLVEKLPPDPTRVIFAGGLDDSPMALFQAPRISHVSELTRKTPPPRIPVLATAVGIEERTGRPFRTWLSENKLRITATIPIVSKVSEGPVDWYLIVFSE